MQAASKKRGTQEGGTSSRRQGHREKQATQRHKQLVTKEKGMQERGTSTRRQEHRGSKQHNTNNKRERHAGGRNKHKETGAHGGTSNTKTQGESDIRKKARRREEQGQ
jgi:hypothetical protein